MPGAPDVTPSLVRAAIAPVSPGPVPPRATPDGLDRALRHAHANEQLNGRLPFYLGPDVLAPAWAARLDPDLEAGSVLLTHDRVLVQGLRRWALLDRLGAPIRNAMKAIGDMVLDPVLGGFFYDDDGSLSGRRLDTGAQAFSVALTFASTVRRTFLSLRDGGLIVAGRRQPFLSEPSPPPPGVALPPPAPPSLDFTHLEAQTLGNPLTVDDGVLTSSRRTREVIRHTGVPEPLHVAASDVGVVIAVKGVIYLGDRNLTLSKALSGDFVPGALSLDELGRIYLVAWEGARWCLWVLTPNGDRVALVPLPGDESSAVSPPIVGYDHRAYVIVGDTLSAVSPAGECLWQYRAPNALLCASVTADDQLLVAVGDELLAFDAVGNARLCFSFDGDALRTPPVLTADGEVLVASASTLYCLAPAATW